VKIKGISPIADHWRTKAEELERQCARQSALLREYYSQPGEKWAAMYKSCDEDRTRLTALLREAADLLPNDFSGAREVKARIERELKG
jgi:hypothetical protein